MANSLIGVLLRFWQEPVAIMADNERMFHLVRVNKEDRNLLRSLWWPEGDTSKELDEYTMTVHLFGAVSSAHPCKLCTAKKLQRITVTHFMEKCLTQSSNFYVDDCLKPVLTEKQAISLVKDLREMCSWRIQADQVG